MKTRALLPSLLFAGTLVFVSCGDEITKTYPGTGEGPSTVADIAEADSCTADNSGALVFSEKTQSLYVCNGKKWIDLGVSQGDAPEIPDSLLNIDCSFGKTDGGWLRMVCGGKTVDSVKIEQNGSANGCAMERLGEDYVVSCGGKVVDTLSGAAARTSFDLKFTPVRSSAYGKAKFASDLPLFDDTTLTFSVENFPVASKIKNVAWYVWSEGMTFWFEDFAVVEGNQPYVLELSNITSTPGFDPIRDLGTRIRFVAAVTTEDGETTVAADSTRFYLSFVDERDTTVYPLVYARANFWMAANLNYGARVDLGETQQAGEKWCPGADEAQCAKFGALYQWHTAFGLEPEADTAAVQVNDVGDSTVQGICPDGWKIPDNDSWEELLQGVSGTDDLLARQFGGTDLLGWNGTAAGVFYTAATDTTAPEAYQKPWSVPANAASAYWSDALQFGNGGTASAIILKDLLYNDSANPLASSIKEYGLSLRCVAIDPCELFFPGQACPF